MKRAAARPSGSTQDLKTKRATPWAALRASSEYAFVAYLRYMSFPLAVRPSMSSLAKYTPAATL